MESTPENNQTPLPNTVSGTTADTAAASAPVEAPRKNVNLIIAIVAAIIILGGAGYYAYSNHYARGGVVSIVNGEKIYREDFDKNLETIKQGAIQQGVDVTDPAVLAEIQKQSLQMLIDNVLLITAATEAGMTATEEEVKQKYDTLVLEVGGEEALSTQLTAVNLSREELSKNIRERVLVDKYIESVTDIEEITVTEEEITAFYEGLDVPNLPPIEDIKPQIQSQILMQKQQTVLADLIEGLRGKATIINKI